MANGLSVSNIVNVTINMSPKAAQARDFGAFLIVGPSDIIDSSERIRRYSDLNGVIQDFGTDTPEYYAADLFFSQSPQPSILYIGRFIKTSSPAVLNGGVLSSAQQAMSNFTPITDGSFDIEIDGVKETISGLDFSSQTNLNGIASIITTELAGLGTVVWNATNQHFVLRNETTGISSTLGYATTSLSGTDVSSLLGFTEAMASVPVDGLDPETPIACITTLADVSADWYGCMISVPSVTDAEHLEIAAFIEGNSQSTSRVYGITVSNTQILDSVRTDDLASKLKSFAYKRTLIQFSTSSPYAVASLFGRAFTVNFNANNATITLKFKQEPGVRPEKITESQAVTLKSKNCNVFVAYNNDTSIIQEGVMSSGDFIDERHGLDWLQNRVQTDVYNLLYTSTTKIPQTDAGNHLLVTRIQSALEAGVNNGLIAPGIWNADGFGFLAQGDTLPTGYYVYAPPVSSQAQSDREARKSVPIQCAVKLAGAIHFVDVQINVNR